MQLQPKIENFPRIRSALKVYRVTSVIAGIMLLLLCAVMAMRYGFKVELFLFTPDAVAQFLPSIPKGQESEFLREGFDLFKAFLIAHGWFYLLYLVSAFMLWSPLRWNFIRFLIMACAGVVPFMSFVLEGRIAREVSDYLSSREKAMAGETK